MSMHHLREVWKMGFETSGLKLVALALADMANEDGVCWPSRQTLATRCGLEWRYVRKCLAKLSASGLVSISERFQSNRQRSNLYTFQVPGPCGDTPTAPGSCQPPPGMSPGTSGACPADHPESPEESSLFLTEDVAAALSARAERATKQKDPRILPVEIPPEWKPSLLTKEQQLAALPIPPDYPSQDEFDLVIRPHLLPDPIPGPGEGHGQDTSPSPEASPDPQHLFGIEDCRPNLYRELCQHKWHQWDEKLRKWIRIRHWPAYLQALNQTILAAQETSIQRKIAQERTARLAEARAAAVTRLRAAPAQVQATAPTNHRQQPSSTVNNRKRRAASRPRYGDEDRRCGGSWY